MLKEYYLVNLTVPPAVISLIFSLPFFLSWRNKRMKIQ